MGHAIPHVEILEELIENGMELERAYESASMWQVYRLLPEEGLEDLKDFVFEMKIRSGDHYHELREIADDLGLDPDPSTDYDQTLLREGMSLVEVLERLREHERVSREFYTRVADSLRKSDLEGVDTDGVAERMELLAQEEGEHAERYGEAIGELRSRKDRSYRV